MYGMSKEDGLFFLKKFSLRFVPVHIEQIRVGNKILFSSGVSEIPQSSKFFYGTVESIRFHTPGGALLAFDDCTNVAVNLNRRSIIFQKEEMVHVALPSVEALFVERCLNANAPVV